MKEYLANPWRFHRIYIQKISTFTDSPATLVGKAFHKCLELYYTGPEFRTDEGLAKAKETGLQIIRAGAAQVDWGKTGSLEKAEADALQTIEHYFAENPMYEVHGSKLTPERILSGIVKGFPVSIKAVSDLTIESDHGVTIVDFKKVSQLTDGALPAAYQIQGWFNEKAFTAVTGTRPTKMLFHEVKTSKNKDGSPQSFRHMIDFTSDQWKATDKAITKMVKSILKDISRKGRVWLPNVSDMNAGEDSWNEYLSL